MSTYICTKCGCIDNTACGGNYWNVVCHNNGYADENANKELLCVECTPVFFKDGSGGKGGVWHNSFKKRHWSELGKEKILSIASERNVGNLINAKDYFERFVKDDSI